MPTGLQHIQYGNEYPLVDPPDYLQNYIADMTVSYSNPAWEYNLPFVITWLDQTNIQISDANNSVVFDSRINTCTQRSTQWGGSYTVRTWCGENVIIKMVTRNDVGIRNGKTYAPIDIRAVWCAPKHLLSLNGYQGDITIKAGTNTELSISDNVLTINAVAGAGSGKCSSSCSTPSTNGIKSINGIYPDSNGRINIDADEGYHLSINCNTLKLANSDDPCCPCSTYDAFSEYVNKVADAYRVIGGKARWLSEQQTCIATGWNAAVIKPKAEAIHLAMVTGPCPYLAIRVEITNIHKEAMDFVSFKGIFNVPVKRVADVKTSMESTSGELSVLADGELINVGAVYDRVKYDYERLTTPLEVTDVSCEFEGCIEPKTSVFYEATFMLKQETTGPIVFHLTSANATYKDNLSAGLSHAEDDPIQRTCDCTLLPRGYLSQSPLLSGKHWIQEDMNCNETIQDTVTNISKVLSLKEGIYEIKRRLWPCEDDEEEEE